MKQLLGRFGWVALVGALLMGAPSQALAQTANVDFRNLYTGAVQNVITPRNTLYVEFPASLVADSTTRFLDVSGCSDLSFWFEPNTASSGTSTVVSLYGCTTRGTFANVCQTAVFDNTGDGVPDAGALDGTADQRLVRLHIAGFLVVEVDTAATGAGVGRLNVTCID